MAARNRNISLQADFMGTVGKILVDEHYPTEIDDAPLFDKIESIRSNVKFEQCYERSKLIGDGKFGKVYLVREKSTGTEFAAKVIRLKQQADRQEVEREVSILTQLRHPRIAQIYDAFYTANNEVVLVMEIVRGGELFDRVADENYVLTEQAVVMIICQLCEAIDYIHEQNILHLDIKPENIMCVSQTGNRIKLIDFGLARYYDGTQELRYMAGTPEFAAPEVIKYEQLDFHTDMWSVGVITYILLSGYSPFLGENICETYCNVEKGVWEFTEEFDSVSEEAKDFVSRLIVYDKRKRMLPKECLAHPWIAKHRAKASSDTHLERPAEGPVMDKKQMMRYNAKRKFRLVYVYMRLITYVKVLIELNRLRRTALNCRMSQSGQKYFETLLMAAEQEKQMAKQNLAKASTCEVPLPTLSEKGSSDEKLNKIGEASTSTEPSEVKEKRLSTKTKRPSPSSSPEKIKAAPAAGQKLEEHVVQTATTEVPLKKKKSEKKTDAKEHISEKKSDIREQLATKPPHPIAQPTNKMTLPTNGENKFKKESEEQSLLGKKMPIPEVVVTVPPKQTATTSPKTSVSGKTSPTPIVPETERLNDVATRRTENKKVPESPTRKSASLERTTLATEKAERRSLREKKLLPWEANAGTPPKPISSVLGDALKTNKKPGETSSRESSSERTKKDLDDTLKTNKKPGNISSRESSSERTKKVLGEALKTSTKAGNGNSRESSSERTKKAPDDTLRARESSSERTKNVLNDTLKANKKPGDISSRESSSERPKKVLGDTLRTNKKPGEISSRESSSERAKTEATKSENTTILQTSGKLLVIRDGPLKKLGGKKPREPSSERRTKNEPAAKEEKEGAHSLRLRKSAAPEAIITVPPKKTVLGAPQVVASDENRSTPIRLQRFGSSESGDSTKENRNMEEKKPTRQGALRKKERPAEDPIISSLLATPEQTTLGSTLLKKRASADDVKPLIAKANVDIIPPAGRSVENVNEGKSITHKRGSLVQEQLLKLNANTTTAESFTVPPKPPRKEAHEKNAPEKTQEQKKAKLLPITTESKTTTTTLTSTSTKTRKASLEKKVQHISQGKNVEEVERTCTEQDNVNVRKITLKKSESQDVPGLTTTVQKNVVKQDSLRSTAEKERVVEEGKDSTKTLKTARSAMSKIVDKVTVEESSKVNGKTTKVSVAGTKDVTRKVNEKAEVDVAPQGNTLKKTEVIASEKIKATLDVGKDSMKTSLEKTTVQKIVVNPTMSAGSSKEDVPSNTSLRSRSASPASKTPAQKSSLKKEKDVGEGNKTDTKPPAPPKNAPAKEAAAEPDKVPATVTKTTSVKLRDRSIDMEETKMKRKRATIASTSAQETTMEFVPREDFSFDALKDKLIRRVSTDHQKPAPKKECIPITSVSSVRDRLRQFESKK
ncbi:kinase domain protein [Ancylostoma caninum]|uniref:Kinase domain protein n=2 Tax=Strongyloidea TaxID=27829 RepID=A0A368H634_ANCCA|nr:kinase domain protein [Ancylostoma caninum]